MQGQRGTIGSLPETLNFDHGSTSSSAAIDQQICWNNMQNPAENLLPDYMLPPIDTNILYANSIGHERHNLSGWSLGEPSSSSTHNEASHDEQNADCGWSSSLSTCTGSGPRLEGHTEATDLSVDNVNVNPLSIPSSSSGAIVQNLNLNAGFVGHGADDCQAMEYPNLYKSNGPQNDLIPPRGSDNFILPSRTGGCFAEENDTRPGCSLDGRHASRKRKALEANAGQSSCSYFQRAESSAGPAGPWYNVGGSLNISAPSEQLNPRLGLGVRRLASDSLPNVSVAGNGESSHRNFRVRTNPPNQQESTPSNLLSSGSALRHPSVSSFEQSSRLPPVGHSLDFRVAPMADNAILQNQPAVVHASALQRNEQSFRWGGGSSSRTGGSSSSLIPGDNVSREGARSRSVTRNILEHPMFIPAPDLRNLVRNPTISSGGNVNIPGDAASSSASQTGPNSGVHPSSAPTWVPHRNPSRYPRRLSEYVRRTLFSSSGSEPGGQSSNSSPLGSGPPASMQEMERSSAAGNHVHHQSYARSASGMERQGNGVVGYPTYSMRTLPTAGEGRRRLVSEIRNVLDLMRRGDGLRLEDVMILDHSMLFGVADIHDRHRDMRLDVDNMSYEELLALEERIGNVCTGLSEESVSKCLKQRKYSITEEDQTEAEPCSICQEEYIDGEDLGALQCGHNFHIDCIKQWLMHKNLCPICKTEGLSE